MNNLIKNAVDVSQRAQRNYDLSKTIPMCDLETLIYAVTNSPSKQNETHYGVKVYTDYNIIKKIYQCTKKFLLVNRYNVKKSYNNVSKNIHEPVNNYVTNSQVLANALFVFYDDNNNTRCDEHILAKKTTDVYSENYRIYNEQKNYSIGIAVGELILTAALLGYKTGICTAFSPENVSKIVNTKNNVKLLVGVGFENINTNRRLHTETLNKDVPEQFRNGDLDEKWRFPSFEKHVKISINEV